jgi:hypothetical protein
VAAALSTEAPPADQLEPNDDVVYALPLGTPNHGSWPLTTPIRSRASIAASVTATKDPVDVYRTWVPARGTLTATVTPAAGLTLRLWSDTTPTVAETGVDRHDDVYAAASAAGTLTYRSRSGKGRYLYLEVASASRVRPAAHYTLDVSVR